MDYTALIVAAGSGTRMGLGYNKLLYRLQSGKTIIETTIAVFANDKDCKQLIVVGNKKDEIEYKKELQAYQYTFVLGGNTRQESVYEGLKAVKEEYVFIHDGARPWLSQSCIDRIKAVLPDKRACLLMVPVKDTIKQVSNGIVNQTYDRSLLWQAQTPQAFQTGLIKECYEIAKQDLLTATDDAQLVELCNTCDVCVIEGSYENKKITTLEDIA